MARVFASWRTHKRLIAFTLIVSLVLPFAEALSGLVGWVDTSLAVHRLIDGLGFSPTGYGLHYQPWGIVSYPFIHYDVLLLLVNMLVLWAVGDVFDRIHSDKAIFPIYIMGSITGGLCYALVLWVIELLGFNPVALPLFGSSAGIYALCFALAMSRPQMKVRLPIVGQTNFLIVLVILYALTTLLGFANWGGVVAHLGGALYGLCWGLVAQQGGRDYPTEWWCQSTAWLSSVLCRKSRRMPIKNKGSRAKARQEDIALARILIKIRRSGYASLTEEEKAYLKQTGHQDL